MKKILGVVAAFALMASGAAEAAKTRQQQGSGGSGQQATQQMQQEITGRVLSASRNQVILEYQGAAVPFTIDRSTRFMGVTSARELQEGQQVRANFQLKNNQNQLKSLQFMGTGQGTGGTGEEAPSDQPQEDTDSAQPKTY